jgi:hypothetical protein
MTHDPDTNITMSPTAEETVILGERVMSEIAADIRKAAESAVSSAYQTGVELQMHQSFALVEKVAEAILAERERCARIAAECAIAVPLTQGAADGASIAARQIETAIRGEA